MSQLASGTHASTATEQHGHHIVPLAVYYRVFAALMVLLVLTLFAATFDLGPLNVVIALTIACAKALLVVLYFMHVRYSHKLVWVFGGAAILWLGILFAYTIGDYISRGWLPIAGR
ncbi:MAG TPA: cytochrome C oxidase subunit IV family protein [Armatimonadota bacterium]|jgi:cytochrome c oxidase subunit 4